MFRWERPYESRAHSIGRVVFATVCTLGALTLLIVSATNGSQSLPSIIATAVFIAVAWRIAMVGVRVGERGVKINMVGRTRVVRWPDFERVRLGPATGHDASALWISVRGGRDIETPLWRAGTRARHRNRTQLEQPELSRLMERLRAEARAHSEEQPQ